MNLYCIARVIEVFASFYVDCNIMKIFPLSVMINSYLVSILTQSYYLYYQYYWFSVNHRKEDACITHTSLQTLYIRAFSCFCSFTVDYSSYSCYIQSLLIWGGGRGSPGLVCNFPAWLMPPAHHRKAKARPDVYLWGCSKAWESRSSQACIYSPAAQTSETISALLKNTHIIFICFTIVKTLRRGWTHL